MRTDNAPLKMNLLRQRGLSLVELMISLTIGLMLLAGLSLLFVESSRSHRELSEASKQIENGRYALQLLTDDLHLAGFYGRFSGLSTMTMPATVPDPCEVTSTATMYDALPIHIQGYAAANFTSRPTVSALCDDFLTSANLLPGSDVFVIRRADASTNGALAATAVATSQEVYIQATPAAAEIQKGNGAVIGANKANGFPAATNSPVLLNNDNTSAPIRKYHVHVYFVAPCSMPSGGTADIPLCTASDDGGRPMPTLKRLELTLNNAGTATAMRMVSLVEGIEMLKIDYGVDSDNEGSPNSYLRTPATVPADWANVMGVNLYILSRNPQLTASYTDTKSYAMGVAGSHAPGGNFKRHAYNASVRLNNPSMRREIP